MEGRAIFVGTNVLVAMAKQLFERGEISHDQLESCVRRNRYAPSAEKFTRIAE